MKSELIFFIIKKDMMSLSFLIISTIFQIAKYIKSVLRYGQKSLTHLDY